MEGRMSGRWLVGGASLFALLLSLPQGAPMPPPPFEMYDIWWEGGAASSCRYYNTGPGYKDFFLNCSITATKEEASIKHNQPMIYSTGSPNMVYTKCHKGSADCGTKDLCMSAYPTSFPKNRTVKNRGCLEDLHIDKLVAEWEISSLVAWRGVTARGKTEDEHQICTSPFFFSKINPDLTRCVKVTGNDIDLDNMVIDFGPKFTEFLYYTQLEGGQHHACSLNATDISTSTPTCSPLGFRSAQRPRLAARPSGINGATEILMATESRICVISGDLIGEWDCIALNPQQGPAEMLATSEQFPSRRQVVEWVVRAGSSDDTMLTCNTTLPAGSRPVTCYPYGGPNTPKGRTTSISVRSGYHVAGALIESKEGMVLCARGAYPTYSPTCSPPLGRPAANLGAVFEWMFQSVDPSTGELSICSYDFGHSRVACTKLDAPFAKISPFKGWLEGGRP